MNKNFSIQSKSIFLDSSKALAKTLHIKDGKIFSISDYGSDSSAIDFGELTVFPGIVDTHAHINEPGRTDWEGFATATKAAAAGGITTVIDMPLNSIPPTTTLENLRIKKNEAAKKCSIDYGFWGGVIPGNSSELQKMVEAGILGFKCFTIDSGVQEFPMVKKSDLEIAMPILSKLKIPLLVHAELESTVQHAHDLSHQRYQFYLDSRPQRWEVDAIKMMIELCRKTGCPIHIVHLSAADALTEIRKAKEEGLPISVETCPHYLYFYAEEIHDGETQFKCAPPIRNRKNQDALWSALLDGTIDAIVSDHSPCTANLKCLESGDFEKAWGGISGLQYSTAVIWSEMRRRKIDAAKLVRWMCENTAKISGVAPRKGSLQIGSDADFCVIDLTQEFEVKPENIQHKNKITPYEKRVLYGKVSKTYVRGQCVYDEGRFLNLNSGECVR